MKTSLPLRRILFTLTVFILAAQVPATWAATFEVTNTNDSGPGSLRQAVADSVASTEPDIILFNYELNGRAIRLTTGEISFPTGQTTEMQGIDQIQGTLLRSNGTHRHFYVPEGATVVLNRLTLAEGGGEGEDEINSGYGGAIENLGTLTLTDCVLHDNRADYSGAIDCLNGSLTLERCTLHDNVSDDNGGAITIEGGTGHLTNCTLTANTSDSDDGAVRNVTSGTLTLHGCTITGNSGGGVTSQAGLNNAVTLIHCIIAGNEGGDVTSTGAGENPFSSQGGNLTGQGNANSAFGSEDTLNLAAEDLKLAPLGFYGGLTPTLPPLSGSPALDYVHSPNMLGEDQRGFFRFNGEFESDSGAVESHVMVVTTGADELDVPAGAQLSLREALRDAPANALITFDPGITTVTWDSARNDMVIENKAPILDASTFANGLTLDAGSGTNRHFRVGFGAGLGLIRLTLTSGGGTGSLFSDYGGSIENRGALTLVDCTMRGNEAQVYGGAITTLNSPVTLHNCTLTGNTGSAGSTVAIEGGSLRMINCTLTANISNQEYFIFNVRGRAHFTHCTMVGNQGSVVSSSSAGTETQIQNCLIAGNTGESGDLRIFNDINTFTSLGGNFVGTGTGLGAFTAEKDVSGVTLADLRLADLGSYGGHTQTMPPLPDSPVVDAAVDTSVGSDQRGLARRRDGTFTDGDASDSGAVESHAVRVTTTADELDVPAGADLSLREAVRDADPGTLITFSPDITDETMTLAAEHGEVTLDKPLLIAAGVEGIRIDGGAGSNRLFLISTNATVCLADLTLTGGNGGGEGGHDNGGAVSNEGTLEMQRCTLSGNTSLRTDQNNGNGGAIVSTGRLLLSECTLSGNESIYHGGAIQVAGGSALLRQCTLSNNACGSYGGAIEMYSPVRLEYCTISGNRGINAGGGIDVYGGNALLILSHCIVSKNTANGLASDITNEDGTVVREGVNFVTTSSGGGDSGPAARTEDPLLAPLGDYGGPIETMLPLPGSPVRNPASGATTAPFPTDQRGFARKFGSTVDVGSVEAGIDDDYGTIGFESALDRIQERFGEVEVPIYRTNGLLGEVKVSVTTSSGTAISPEDFTALTDHEVTFANGQSVAYVSIAIISDPDLKEPHEEFTLTLSDPTGGAMLGGRITTTVRIVDDYEPKAPTLTLTAPKANLLVVHPASPTITVTGTAKDDKGLFRVLARINDDAPVEALLTGTPVNGALLSATYSVEITGIPGVNQLTVWAMDEKGQISKEQKRSFTYRVEGSLTVDIQGPENSGSVTKGYQPDSVRYLGMPYKIKATPMKGYVFDGWSANDTNGTGITEATAELPELTFTMQPGLELTARFIANPFKVEYIGTYTGLISPNSSPGNHNTGKITVTLTNTGKATIKLQLDGTTLSVAAVLDNDGSARFGKTRSYTHLFQRKGKPDLYLTMLVDLFSGGGAVGFLVQDIDDTEQISVIAADRAFYSSKSEAPEDLAQRFTFVIDPEYDSDPEALPGGSGIGSMTINSSGIVSYAGTLSDGTKFTASSPLTSYHGSVLFASLYKSKGHIATRVYFDLEVDEVDAYSDFGGFLWCRPPQPGVQWFPAGWPVSIPGTLFASVYRVPSGNTPTSAFPGLSGVNETGNVKLTFSDGLLADDVIFSANISPSNAVTTIPVSKPDYTLKLNAKTGEITGTFLHDDGSKPAFKAMIFQKAGTLQGASGYFLTSPVKPVNGEGQSGSVLIAP